MLLALNAETVEYSYSPGLCERILIFTRFDGRLLSPLRETDKVTIRQMRTLTTDLTLVAAHMPSKMYFSESSQSFECMLLAQTIRGVEQQVGHTRTVLVGDLNMNPFEAGVIGANGLHAVMTRQVALKQGRTVQGQSYPFFYNPMWRHYGDVQNSPSGTFYYERAEHVVYFWNMFDQVLLRPELLPFFADDVQILHTDAVRSFLTSNGIPDKEESSDHLPLLFRLNV